MVLDRKREREFQIYDPSVFSISCTSASPSVPPSATNEINNNMSDNIEQHSNQNDTAASISIELRQSYPFFKNVNCLTK